MAVVPEEMIPNLYSLLSLFAREIPPFELNFDQYLLAPPGKPARMIWARYKKHETFTQLHHRIHHLFQQIQVNLQLRKSPIPHITLARMKGTKEAYKLVPVTPPAYGTVKVKRLVLWESISTPKGVNYVERHSYEIGH